VGFSGVLEFLNLIPDHPPRWEGYVIYTGHINKDKAGVSRSV